ncbi:NUDIX hydrolase [Salinirubellus salinus]|uniref:NUDIX hydrolase n=1 Tax=Salinirubellus salinus TaxID=1364945 RepID=UPI003610025C
MRSAPVVAGHEVPVDADGWTTVSEALAEGRDRYVTAVVHDGVRFVLVQNAWSDGWVLPGGGVEAGESLAQAAVREVDEETGLSVDVAGVVARVEQRFVHDGTAALGHLTVFDAPAQTTELTRDLGVTPHEIRDAKWFDSIPERTDGLPDTLFERVLRVAGVRPS